MSKKVSLRDEVKMVANALLVPHVRGLMIDRFLKEYKENESKPLPYMQLGYRTPLEFLQSIPDAVKVVTLQSGITLVQAVDNETNSHIREMVKGQKNCNGNVRVVENLLRNQSFFRNPRNGRHHSGRNSSYQQNRMHSTGSQYSSTNSYSMNRDNHPLITREMQPMLPQEETVSSTSNSSVSLAYELEVVANLKTLLQRYPAGVDVLQVYELYEAKFHVPIMLVKIEKGISSMKFLENHSKVFRLWKSRDDVFMVGLQDCHIEKRTDEAFAETPNPTSTGVDVPRAAPDLLPSTAQVLHHTISENSASQKPKWLATDMRIRDPSLSNKPLEVIEVEWDCKEGTESVATTSLVQPPHRQVQPIDSVSCTPRLPVCSFFPEANLPATFGLLKPKVKDVVDPDTVLLQQEFPRELSSENCFFFAVVTQVNSPGEFYWMLMENRVKVEAMSDNLGQFYNLKSGYEMSRREMYLGQYVAAMYEDNLWYRAVIIGTYYDAFQVRYIDYGNTSTIPIERLRHLPLHFIRLPVQAFRGRIYGIKPVPGEVQWSPEATKTFFGMVRNIRAIAASKIAEEIDESDKSRVYVLQLIDTNGDEDIVIRDVLIDKGLVVDEDTVESPSQSHTKDPTYSSTSLLALPDVTFAPPAQVIQSSVTNSNLARAFQPLNPAPATADYVAPISVQPAAGDNLRRRYVKQLRLNDGRRLHIVQQEGKLYLMEKDFEMLVPNLENRLAELKMKVETKVILAQTHRHIFYDCAMAGAPWMNSKTTEIKLYCLDIVVPLLFLFEIKDKDASSAINAQLQDTEDPFFS